MTERYRIVVVSNRLPPQAVGGAELVCWREICGLRSRGHAVRGFEAQRGVDSRVVGLEPGEPPPDPAKLPLRFRRPSSRYAFSRRPGNEFASNPTLSRDFETLLASFRPDLVHFHNLNGVSLRLPAQALRRKARVVGTLHDGWGVCPKSILLKADGSACAGFESLECIRCLEGGRSRPLSWRRRALVLVRNARIRRELCRFDRLLFPSRHHLEIYVGAGYSRQRCRLLPNPAPQPSGPGSPPAAPPAEQPLRLLYLGSLARHKGLDLLLEALAGLPPQTASLVLHGRATATQLERLERAIRRWGLEDRVRHAGQLPAEAVLERISSADAVVVPSRAVENCPLTILEAMSMARPVIASRIGGIPELVRDGENGLLFPVGDAGGLRAGIARLARDRNSLVRLGQQARASVEKLGMDAHLEGLEALYSELLQPAPRPRRPEG